jgi:hypothetical protein
MSNEIVQAQAVPEYLKKYQQPTANHEDFGEIDSSDLGINMLKIGQSNSRECKKVGWGITGQEPQIAQGSMFLSKDGKIVHDGTCFIPLVRTVKYIHWIGKPGDGRIDFMCDDKNDERITKIDGLAFKKDPNTGDVIAPPVVKYINFYIMLQGFELPILLSFKRTSIPDGKWLTQSTMMATQQNGNIPMHMLVYKIGKPKTVVDGANDWFAFTFQPNGFTPEEAIPKAKKMTEFARNLTRLFSAKEYEAIERGETENLKSAHPDTTVQAPTQAAPVQQQPQQTMSNVPPAAAQFGTPPAPVVTAPPVQQQTPVQQQQQQAPAAPAVKGLW